MANASARDRLFALSNPDKVKEAETNASRSNFRPKWMHLKCDIGSLSDVYEEVLQNGDKAERVSLQLSNMEVFKATEPFQATSDRLVIPVNTRGSSNSEMSLMVASAMAIDPALNWIGALEGLKDVELEDRPHHYEGRRPTGKKVLATSGAKKGQMVDEWDNAAKLTQWYYHVVSIGGVGATAESTKAPEKQEYSEEGMAAAVELLNEMWDASEEKGFEEAVFNGKAIRNKKIQADDYLTKSIGNGTFLEDIGKEGKWLVTEGVIVKAEE